MLLSTFITQRLTLLPTTKERGSDCERLTTLIEAGQVVPSVDRTYSLEEAPAAVRQLEGGLVRGKIAITVER